MIISSSPQCVRMTLFLFRFRPFPSGRMSAGSLISSPAIANRFPTVPAAYRVCMSVCLHVCLCVAPPPASVSSSEIELIIPYISGFILYHILIISISVIRVVAAVLW